MGHWDRGGQDVHQPFGTDEDRVRDRPRPPGQVTRPRRTFCSLEKCASREVGRSGSDGTRSSEGGREGRVTRGEFTGDYPQTFDLDLFLFVMSHGPCPFREIINTFSLPPSSPPLQFPPSLPPSAPPAYPLFSSPPLPTLLLFPLPPLLSFLLSPHPSTVLLFLPPCLLTSLPP